MFSLIKTPPRIHELVFAAVLLWMFAAGEGWSVLLADGDTGWHIRNGEQIIDTGHVPDRDAFAFDSGEHPWFAWEWLSDIVFAALFRVNGLKAVSVFCGIMIAASASILFRHLAWRSVGAGFALPLTLLTVGASSIHYLARPHVIGLLFFAGTAWIIDRARRAPTRWVWSLPIVFLVWANCHGSFLGGVAVVAIWTGEGIVSKRGWGRVAVFGASVAATLCNPYGWNLYFHAAEYLQSTWIQSVVEEFQSPRFRSETMLQFEILLLLGIAAVPWFLRRREWYAGGVILLWAHESLTSVRHVPIYCLAASPFIGSWLESSWRMISRRRHLAGVSRTVSSIELTWQPWTLGFTGWPVILCLAVAGTALRSDPIDFPANKFPVGLVERNHRMLAGRIFSTDQWSDYLIFRLYPSVRIFFDGRSDFFGPWRGTDYQQLMAGGPDSLSILDRERVQQALLPVDWALAGILRADGRWRVAASDRQAVLFVRNDEKTQLPPNQNLAERR